MKISEQEISRLFSLSPSDRSGKAAFAVVSENRIARTGQAAQVEISDRAQEVTRITQLIKELPDVREDRVQALKAQVENGTYNVSSEDIADLIIRRALADNTAL
jgi:negative regulator of flagellin synthesis FlgM